MSWETILKRGKRRKINMPQYREAFANATATQAEFTLSEILPLAQELYKEYLIRDGVYPNNNVGKSNASMHAKTAFKNRGRSQAMYGRVINNLGVHAATKRRKILPSGRKETIYARREE